MNVDLGIWGKLSRVVIFLLLLATVLGIVVWYWPLIQRNERMRKEILRLDDQIRQQEGLARQNKGAVEALKNDPRTVERLAREKLGYAKTNEVVIRFEPLGTNLPAPPTSGP